jgi:hypothetical protein
VHGRESWEGETPSQVPEWVSSLLEHDNGVTLEILHVNRLACLIHGLALLHKKPSSVREPESAVCIVWICNSVRVQMMQAMIARPMEDGSLIGDGIEDHQDKPKSYPSFVGSVSPQPVDTCSDAKTTADVQKHHKHECLQLHRLSFAEEGADTSENQHNHKRIRCHDMGCTKVHYHWPIDDGELLSSSGFNFHTTFLLSRGTLCKPDIFLQSTHIPAGARLGATEGQQDAEGCQGCPWEVEGAKVDQDHVGGSDNVDDKVSFLP